MYRDTAGLVNSADYKSVQFEKDSELLSLKIRGGDIAFNSYKSIDAFRQKIENEINNIIAKEGYKAENQSRYDSDKLTASINITIDKGKK